MFSRRILLHLDSSSNVTDVTTRRMRWVDHIARGSKVEKFLLNKKSLGTVSRNQRDVRTCLKWLLTEFIWFTTRSGDTLILRN